MKTVAFGENTICERGTTCSVFDYAYYNEKFLGNKSIIIYDKNSPAHKKEMIEYIETMFPVVASDSYKDIDHIVEKYEVTHFYKIKYGFNDHASSKIAKNLKKDGEFSRSFFYFFQCLMTFLNRFYAF